MTTAQEISQEMRDIQSAYQQGTFDWFKARLGNITSSNVHFVMKTPRATKADPNPQGFSDTAKGYLYQVAAERNLQPRVIEDDSLFEEYLYRVELSNKAIRYGQENEEVARIVYQSRNKQYEVNQCGFVPHKEIPHYGDSPDGVVCEIIDDIPKIVGCLEIKCPKPETFMRYKATIHNAEELKAEKPEYYWQCQSHCECNDVQWCDFVFYDKMQRNGFACIRIERNEEDIALMKERVMLANEFIEKLLTN